jgi:hypothetical protein
LSGGFAVRLACNGHLVSAADQRQPELGGQAHRPLRFELARLAMISGFVLAELARRYDFEILDGAPLTGIG